MEGLSDKWDIELDTALNGLEALQKVKNKPVRPYSNGYSNAGDGRLPSHSGN